MYEYRDILYNEAKKIMLTSKKTSIAYLQRALQIGYNRAIKIIYDLEKDNFLSKPDKRGKRKIIQKYGGFMKIAITGHVNIEKANNYKLVDFRKYNDEVFQKVYNEIESMMNKIIIDLSIDKDKLILYSGMARGVDEIFALYAIKNNIALFAVIPYKIFWHKSRKESAIEYDKILEYAKKTAGYKEVKKGYKNTPNSYFARNQFMVDEADMVISYLKYPSSGTLDTINRAKKVDKYYGNIV